MWGFVLVNLYLRSYLMVFIYINSRLLQVDASRERRANESSWFCRNVCCTVPVGPGPLFPSLPPRGLCQAPQPGPLKTVSVCSCLHLGSCPGRGLAPCLDQSCRWAARPLHNPVLMAVAFFLGPHPDLQSPTPTGSGAGARWDDSASQVQALRAPPPASYLTGNVFLKMNLPTSQQILHSKKTRPWIFFFCAKNCGHAGSASSGPSCCLILIYCFFFY